jgi:hypothetical protein
MLNNPSDILEQESSNVCDLHLRKDGIVTLEPKEEMAVQTIESMEMDFDIFKNWTKEEKKGFLVDARKFKKFDSEARVYAQKNSPLFFNKYAIVIKSGTSSFLGNMFMHLTKPEIPTKLFSNKIDALEWLKTTD